MDLEQCRTQLDNIDRQIVQLFMQRMQVTEDVAKAKIAMGRNVLDRDREQAKIRSVRAMADTDFNKEGITEVYRQLMALSRKRQYQLITAAEQKKKLPFIPVDTIIEDGIRVVYQGAAGSYSEAAMKAFFGSQVNSITAATFRDAMVAIEEGSADYAVLPIENSTAGIVSEIYDLLNEFENYIVGEITIPIHHCLMGCEGTTEDTIRRVYSHPQSLMQSEKFLLQHPEWEQISMKNNAFAAQKVAKDKDTAEAAIASRYAAEAYGLHIIREGVNQAASNSTRFIVVGNQKIFTRDADKISLVLEIENVSGSLYELLSHFIYNNLNMTKIESRPIEDRDWDYRFFIDFDGNLGESAVQNALRGLRDEAKSMKILGNYKARKI